MAHRAATIKAMRPTPSPKGSRVALGRADALRLPESVALDFAKELVAYLNYRGGLQLQLVLDEDGIAIERK